MSVLAVNFYNHHLGDWAKDVRGLSFIREGAYRRMLDVYYSTEQPLPLDLDECCDLVVTRDAAERKAVEYVLARFFQRFDDGFHQKRADEEIGRFQAKSEQAKSASEKRWAAAKRNANAHANADADAYADALPNAPPNADADAVRTHDRPLSRRNAYPVTNNQYPETNTENQSASAPVFGARASPGEACKAMKAAGMAAVNPSSPKLGALLEQGMTVDELSDAARIAVERGKGFAWALERAAGQRADAANVQLAPQSKRSAFLSEIMKLERPAPEDDDGIDDVRARG